MNRPSQFTTHLKATQPILSAAAMHFEAGDHGAAADALADVLVDLRVAIRILSNKGFSPVFAVTLAEKLRGLADEVEMTAAIKRVAG